MMPALLCLLLHAAAPPVAAAPVDELEEATAAPVGLFTGPAAAVATVAPVMAALAVLVSACPLSVAGCMLVCCRTPRQDVYVGTSFALASAALVGALACGPMLGSVAVVTDALGFLAGQEATRLRVAQSVERASSPSKAGRSVWRRVLRTVGMSGAWRNQGRARDVVVATAVAAPALVGLAGAQLLAPFGFLCAFPYVFGLNTRVTPLVLLPPLLVVGSGVWWLFSVTVMRPLLLLALDSQR